MLEFEKIENLLGVLKKGAKFFDVGLIAGTQHSAIFHIALSNPKMRTNQAGN
jgi:hypothetical protein